MKYHPIRDPKYFRNRDFIGSHWNRKFVRAVQAVLNATKGKIGRGKSFFAEAFGQDIDGFFDILWMPETFIIERMKYKENLTQEWRAALLSDTETGSYLSLLVVVERYIQKPPRICTSGVYELCGSFTAISARTRRSRS